jgi:hypothetical protein
VLHILGVNESGRVRSSQYYFIIFLNVIEPINPYKYFLIIFI